SVWEMVGCIVQARALVMCGAATCFGWFVVCGSSLACAGG
ncbi:putative transmembrane protein, partial [Toxoplasma gondii TgCatPRC2]